MDTPICDFVEKYACDNKIRMHMPGHKGRSFVGCERLDITEIDGADVLYSGNGIIKKSEENASLFFGSLKTLYSTEGSSLCVRAMLWLSALYAEKIQRKRKIIAGRNAHKTFVLAAALLNYEVEWISDCCTGGIVECCVSADSVRQKLEHCSELPVAVYITSPDYVGNVADVGAISSVCREFGVLLIVDNAHGAYLKFLPQSLHPIDFGADMCCDSAHKTLPVLTGGAYLHISDAAPQAIAENAENAMSVFASTSPSYLILQSLDKANAYIAKGYSQKLKSLCCKIDKLKKTLCDVGYSLVGSESLKLTIAPKSRGYTGHELAGILLDRGFVCEFYDPDYVVLMMTAENDDKELDALADVLTELAFKGSLTDEPPKVLVPDAAVSLSEALFCESVEIAIDESIGKIAATPTVSCPPAIPIVVCGERIGADAVECMKYYGITKIKVLKENKKQ